MKIYDLRVNRRKIPMGIANKDIVFSFKADTDTVYTATEKTEFETAGALSADFITPSDSELYAPIFEKSFPVFGNIKKARLYITGLGLYMAEINGNRVGNRYLTPGYNRSYLMRRKQDRNPYGRRMV